MTPLLLALGAALSAGCAGPCSVALDHQEDCGNLDGSGAGGGDIECVSLSRGKAGDSCDGAFECAAECFNEAPCGAFDRTDEEAAAAYVDCVNRC